MIDLFISRRWHKVAKLGVKQKKPQNSNVPFWKEKFSVLANGKWLMEPVGNLKNKGKLGYSPQTPPSPFSPFGSWTLDIAARGAWRETKIPHKSVIAGGYYNLWLPFNFLFNQGHCEKKEGEKKSVSVDHFVCTAIDSDLLLSISFLTFCALQVCGCFLLFAWSSVDGRVLVWNLKPFQTS